MAFGPKTAVKVEVKPPVMDTAIFRIKGTAPLVVHRFSSKARLEIERTMLKGSTAKSKKKEAADFDQLYFESRYISQEGWDGFNAAAIRCALIDACRTCGLVMTQAKMSMFVVADGFDAAEPQFQLVRIFGTPVMQKDIARVETGKPYVTVRAAYHQWEAELKIKYDTAQHTYQDISNLIVRVGMLIGIGEGRPYSKKSAGMGWGTFEVLS